MRKFVAGWVGPAGEDDDPTDVCRHHLPSQDERAGLVARSRNLVDRGDINIEEWEYPSGRVCTHKLLLDASGAWWLAGWICGWMRDVA